MCIEIIEDVNLARLSVYKAVSGVCRALLSVYRALWMLKFSFFECLFQVFVQIF